MPDLKYMMEALGFTQIWLTSGVIGAESLESLHREYESSDDKNTEHYRWISFKQYLSVCPKNEEVARKMYLIAQQETDIALSISMLHEIIGKMPVDRDILEHISENSNASLRKKAATALSKRLG